MPSVTRRLEPSPTEGQPDLTSSEDSTAQEAPQPRSLVRRMLFGASATALLQASSSAIGFLVAVALARLLGGHGYGAYVFALAWASALTIPAGLGLNLFVVRGVAGYEVKQKWEHLRGLLIRANTLVAAASIAIAAAGSAIALLTLAEPLRLVFVLAMALIPINALTILRQSTMQALGRVVVGQIPEFVIRPLILIAGVGALALVGGKVLTPVAAMLVNVAAVSTAFIAGVIALRKAVPEQVRSAAPKYQMREWVSAALPMMLIGGIWQLNGYVSTIAVGTIGGTRDAGIYSAVEKGGVLIVLLLIAANMPFAPLVARMRAKGDLAGMEHGAERIAQASVIASLPIVIFFVALPGVYLGLFGSAFTSGGTALRILVLGELFNATAGPVGAVLIMTGHERAACWGVGLGLLTTVVLTIVLVPFLGVTGAAIADAASFVVWNVALTILCRRRLKINATAFWPLAMTNERR
ncbi:MAG: oligosaccharide flippase family protein [Solirubrobacterales bacterium]|nr:oligosaccharide flippase family protein [Solirubrobacterales bacterium]